MPEDRDWAPRRREMAGFGGFFTGGWEVAVAMRCPTKGHPGIEAIKKGAGFIYYSLFAVQACHADLGQPFVQWWIPGGWE